jgi:hypothetical protein
LAIALSSFPQLDRASQACRRFADDGARHVAPRERLEQALLLLYAVLGDNWIVFGSSA